MYNYYILRPSIACFCIFKIYIMVERLVETFFRRRKQVLMSIHFKYGQKCFSKKTVQNAILIVRCLLPI